MIAANSQLQQWCKNIPMAISTPGVSIATAFKFLRMFQVQYVYV